MTREERKKAIEVLDNMKVLIDIPKETYNDIQSRDWKNGELIFSEEWKAIHNGTPIPDNATNGDVLKAIFPNTVFAEDEYEDDGAKWVDMISDDGMTFEMDFWNAPYQKGGSDND